MPAHATAAAREVGRLARLLVDLFKRLAEAHPKAVCRLRRQYRMAADIMALPNALVYSGQLRCAHPALETASLALPHPRDCKPAPGSEAAWAAASTLTVSGVELAGTYKNDPLGFLRSPDR